MIELDRNSSVPLGDQIVAGLAALVEQGRLAEGVRLPSLRQLATRLEVSSSTVVNAYDRLVAQGLIESRPGSGYFVRRRRALGTVAEMEGVSESPTTALGFAMNALDPSADTVQAGSGFLPGEWLADALPASLVARVMREQPPGGVPAPAQGTPVLRRRLAEKLHQQGVVASPSQIVVTFGASHAYDLLFRALLQPGDAVMVEDPGYLVLHAQLAHFGARLLPVPRLGDGPDLEALEAVASEHRPRLFFTQTLLHNPGGSSTSAAKCHKLLRLAERHDFRIVEDDAYGDLARPEALRLAALDELARVFYIGSFTKVLNPSLRCGYVAAPPAFVQALVEHKILGVLSGSALQEDIIAAVLESGRFGKHVARLRTRIARSRAAAEAALVKAGVEVAERNAEGLFIWGRMPGLDDADALVRAAQAEGILLAKGQMFSPTGGYRDHLRFSAVHSAHPRLTAFLERHIMTPANSASVLAFPSRGERRGG